MGNIGSNSELHGRRRVADLLRRAAKPLTGTSPLLRGAAVRLTGLSRHTADLRGAAALAGASCLAAPLRRVAALAGVALLAGSMLLTGCAKESAADSPADGGGARVTLSFSAEGPLHAVDKGAAKARGMAATASALAPAQASAVTTGSGPATRGVLNPSMVDEWAVADMWVLQYDMSGGPEGSLAARRYVGSVVQDGATVRVTADLEPMEKARIVVLANAPGFFSESELPTGSTLADLAALTFDIHSASGSALPEEYSAVLPMRGDSESEMKLEMGQVATVRVPLYRLVSKVHFTVSNLCTEGYPNLTLTDVTLRNVPAVGSYARVAEATHAAVRYPAAGGDNFKDYDAIIEGLGAGCELLWYMAPNSRGVGSGTTPADKTLATAPQGQGDYCSYVLVQGMIQMEEMGPLIPMSYRVYLGGNSVNDYNVWANRAYRIRMTISSLPDAPEVEVGHDGFTVELAGTDGEHDNTVEGWEILVEGATVAPDPSGGMGYAGGRYTFTVFGSFTGTVPVRIAVGGSALATGNASAGTPVTLTLPENTATASRTVLFQYSPEGSWTTIKSGTQQGTNKPADDVVDGGNLWVDRKEMHPISWFDAKSTCEAKGMRLPKSRDELRGILRREKELGLELSGGCYWCRGESSYGGGGLSCAEGVERGELTASWVYWKHEGRYAICVKDK